MKIYYFSGTGNSLAVAKDIARKFSAKLIPAVSTAYRETLSVEDDAIGFVFPVYAFNPPPVVNEMIKKIEDIQTKYLFAICTYGITPSRCLINFARNIECWGGKLSGGFAVEMPHNVFDSSRISQESQNKLIHQWKRKLNRIIDYLNRRSQGKIESEFILNGFFRAERIRMIPLIAKLMRQMIFKGTESLAFAVKQNCNGCGICQSICPGNNIELIHNSPCWRDHCLGCLACMHWCPQQAITMGTGDFYIKTYHHPEVNISDMKLIKYRD